MARRRYDGWVTPTGLDDRTQRELWEGLKKLDPTLASMLTKDPNISELKNAFSATVQFTTNKAREYVMEGRKVIEEKQHANSKTRLADTEPAT